MSRVIKSPVQANSVSASETRLGERLRYLRAAAEMTQTELAGDRFSKEYLSQIERGKTKPTRETLEWLAARLSVDADFLVSGVSVEERGRVEAALARAEALVQSDSPEDALQQLQTIENAAAATGAPDIQIRLLLCRSRALLKNQNARGALTSITRARELAETHDLRGLERAEAHFVLGVCRYMLSSTTTAIGLLNVALELAERSDVPADSLRAEILHWRSRCYRRQRDYEAAKDDVELALELAERLRDPKTLGHLYFQASLLAERDGRWVLARTYAERAKAHYEAISDRADVARLQNNLGGLNFLLGNPEKAIRYLKDSFATALEVGEEASAAQAISSLAQVHLRTGDIAQAEQQARQALSMLDGRVDFLDEIGSAQLVLGRALMEQQRLDEAEEVLVAADLTFEQLGSASHRAGAWVAQGDLAARRGDDRSAAHLYRKAAEALQDVRF